MRTKLYHNAIGFIILIISVIAFWYLGKHASLQIQAIQDHLSKLHVVVSSAVFVLLYVLVTFFIWFSKDAFWLMGVFLFGPYLSAALISISETINAVILFTLSRRLGRGFLEQNLSGGYRNLDQKISKIGLVWLFLLRAAPLVPYRFLDIAAGLTRIDLRKYLFAVILGSPLKIFWVQYILYGVGSNIYDMERMSNYFLENRFLLILSLAYLAIIPLLAIKIRSRG